MLTSGVGFLIGSLIKVMTSGVIRTMVDFQGILSSWWTKIFVGSLMLLCIVMQVFIVKRGKAKKAEEILEDTKVDENHSEAAAVSIED